MSNPRRSGGRETWHRLLDWDNGQADSERLAARFLWLVGATGIEPSHPLGGPDRGKDLICELKGKRHLVAVYFPRGAQGDAAVRRKFLADLKHARNAGAEGMVFFTNQELSLGVRAEFAKAAKPMPSELLHLEAIAAVLDTPAGYGLRIDFLRIAMTLEEQVAFFASRDKVIEDLKNAVDALVARKTATAEVKTAWTNPPDPYGYASIGLLGDHKVKVCRSCGEVFRAQRNHMTISVYSSQPETVTCPECGKVQTF